MVGFPQAALRLVQRPGQGLADVHHQQFDVAVAGLQGAGDRAATVEEAHAVGLLNAAEGLGQPRRQGGRGRVRRALPARLIQDGVEFVERVAAGKIGGADQDRPVDRRLVGAGRQEPFQDGPDASHLLAGLVRQMDERGHRRPRKVAGAMQRLRASSIHLL